MDEYLGVIKLFSGNFIPQNYELCDGRLLNINANQALFSILGTQFGGDGQTTFGLPNLSKTVPASDLTYIICVNGIYPSRS